MQELQAPTEDTAFPINTTTTASSKLAGMTAPSTMFINFLFTLADLGALQKNTLLI